jgi:OmcA/MtrC family decaheme c-type cytochrome
VAWPAGDYRNNSNGVQNGQPIAIDALATGTYNTTTFVKTVTLPTGSVLPATTVAGASWTVGLQGRVILDSVKHEGTTYEAGIKNASASYALATGAAITAPTMMVDIAKCNACHKNLEAHGWNRSGDLTVCTMCHNTEAVAAPGEAIDFRTMVHQIHTAQFPGYEDATYPAPLVSCQTCHTATGYIQPLATSNGTTTTLGATNADNLRTTKFTATCSSCHSATISVDHMIMQGGLFNVTQPQIDALNQ